ncbi:MAG: glycosyltransferase family 39 protein [Robiginitomaculum sp.]
MNHGSTFPKFSNLKAPLLLALLTLLVSLPGLSSLSVIDRDEARYAQATMQMLESGEYVDIRFQDAPRWKKPAGAYWAQALSVKAFTGVNAREIWAHRVPSVLGALLAVLATYWGGAKLIGREPAAIGAALLAVSLSMVFEAHIAKTDSLLTGFCALMLAALAYLRVGADEENYAGRGPALVFWMALGAAIMMKGPIALLIALTCFIALAIWERSAIWLRPLRFWLGPLVCIAIVAPWAYLIWTKTDGQFFAVAIGEDLAPKLTGGAEKHGAPAGYYLATVWVMLWPGAAFLLAGLALAWKNIRGVKTAGVSALGSTAKFLLCWAVPWWIIVEISATKLPHYTLPVYPALCLLAGAAAVAIAKDKAHPIARTIGAALYMLVGALLAGGVVYAQSFGGAKPPSWEYAIAALIIIGIIVSAILLMRGRARAIWGVIASGAALSIFTFGHIMPSLERLTISKSVAKLLKTEQGYALPLPAQTQVYSPNFSEPSLVYHLGSHIKIGMDKSPTALSNLPAGTLLIVDKLHKEGPDLMARIAQDAQSQLACFENIGEVDGENYSKGDTVKLSIMRRTACTPNK